MTELQHWHSIYQSIQALSVQPQHRFIIIKPYGVKFSEAIYAYLQDLGLQILNRISITSWHSLALFLYLKAEVNSNEWQKRLFINRSFAQMEGNVASLVLLPEQLSFPKLSQLKSDIRQFTGSEKIHKIMADGQKIVLTLNAVHTPDEERLQYELKVLHYFLPQLENKS